MRRIAVLALLATGLSSVANAAPCDGLTNPIYLQVGDTQANLLKRLARALRDNTSKPLTLVWITNGSCPNIQAIYNRTAIAAGTTMQYVESVAENATWTPATANKTCEAPSGGIVPDVANSALFTSACGSAQPPSTVKLTLGPVQAYVMAVPKASNQTAITFEEAYFVFGFGAAGMIEPWVNEAQMFIRTVSKSTLLAWSFNISVPADKFKGVRFDGSPMVVSALQSSTSPAQAIGLLGAEVYDSLRDSLFQLAFRAKGQQAAYFPDSTSTSRDKKNVRDGHYTVWSPTVWMDTTDAGGAPVKPDARYVVDLIAGKEVSPAQSFDMTTIVAAVGLVPDCAMGVKREFEGGPLSIYKPAQSCVCKYESAVATTSCSTCSAGSPCSSGVCRNGYCEVQ